MKQMRAAIFHRMSQTDEKKKGYCVESVPNKCPFAIRGIIRALFGSLKPQRDLQDTAESQKEKCYNLLTHWGLLAHGIGT